MPAFTLAPNEQIILLLRRHWLRLTLKLAEVGILIFVPPLIYLLLVFVWPSLMQNEGANPIFWYFALLFWLITSGFLWLAWLDWYLDIWLVTNQRIIDIEQRRLFNRRVLACGLDKIQNVTAKTGGLLATFFKYGNVEIKTADETSQIIFYQVPSPNVVQDKILQAHQEYLRNFGVPTQT
ncbi:MAG: hypothetical protein LiPW39_105 [Parcubacteria group bacterium LiPW_39]|nr:MAG: hypothetical protein LiPW39_105 [Parcubacteria group bacterium LiPW_39]